jgi:hypothetical protein
MAQEVKSVNKNALSFLATCDALEGGLSKKSGPEQDVRVPLYDDER